jgi:hypothetical protein
MMPCGSWSSLPSRREERFQRSAAPFAARVTTEGRLSLAENRYVLARARPRAPDALAVLLRPYVAE